MMEKIKKTVTKKKLSELKKEKSDLNYWLSKTPDERIFAVEELRRQHPKYHEEIRKVVKVIKLHEKV